jgi:hypothetical protein
VRWNPTFPPCIPLNSFCLLTQPALADAILGVSLFASEAPDQFGKFNRAFVTLFRIAAGETWIDSLAMLGPNGDLEWRPSLFICSFIVVSVWVVLQVSVAVPRLACSMRISLTPSESLSSL